MSFLVKLVGIFAVIFSGGIGMAHVAGKGAPPPEFAAWFTHPDGTPCNRFCLFGIVVGGTHIDEAQRKLEAHPLTQGMIVTHGISGDSETGAIGATVILSGGGARVIVNALRSVVSSAAIYAMPELDRNAADALPIVRAIRSANLGSMVAWLRLPRSVSSSDLFVTETIVFPNVTGARVTMTTRAKPGTDRRLTVDHEFISFAITGSTAARVRLAAGSSVSGRWQGFTSLDHYGDKPTPIPTPTPDRFAN
jgi:hypothetical protein